MTAKPETSINTRIRRWSLPLFAVVMMACSPATKESPEETTERRLIIGYVSAKPGAKAAILERAKELDATVVNEMNALNMVVVQLPTAEAATEAMRELERLPDVLTIERDQTVQLQGNATTSQ